MPPRPSPLPASGPRPAARPLAIPDLCEAILDIDDVAASFHPSPFASTCSAPRRSEFGIQSPSRKHWCCSSRVCGPHRRARLRSARQRESPLAPLPPSGIHGWGICARPCAECSGKPRSALPRVDNSLGRARRNSLGRHGRRVCAGVCLAPSGKSLRWTWTHPSNASVGWPPPRRRSAAARAPQTINYDWGLRREKA